MTDMPHALTSPVKYTPRPKTVGLRLNDIIVFRRLRNGQSQSDIARHMHLRPNTINAQVRKALARYGVETIAEFLALEEVKQILDAK
jgi:DNA-binding CsgD family transcriptional regulator